MMLTPVTEGEVAAVIRDLKAKHSRDVYGLSGWLLKQCFHTILKPLARMINFSFQTGQFPNGLKNAKIIPLFKKGDSKSPSNYRPIAILPTISKIFEKLFLIRMLSFLDVHDILCKEQFGFRKGISTIDAVTKLIDIVVKGLDRQIPTLSVFLDLSKAFDCVDHQTLISKLHDCGIRGTPLSWLESYLSSRLQKVHINGVSSNNALVKYGVPQGSILGPALFLIYVNDLRSSISTGQMIQYADDTTLCFQSKCRASLEVECFVSANSCLQFLSKVNLQTNDSKSNFIYFSGRRVSHDCGPSVVLNDTVIEELNSIKFLGIHIDKSLTWDNHVDAVCAKMSSGIFALRKLAEFCAISILKMAYYGLVYPHMSYGITLWGGCANTHFQRCFVLQKKAIRIISKIGMRESCREHFKSLDLLTLPSLYMYETVLYCRYKCEVTRGRDIHDYNTRGRDALRPAQHRLRAFEALPSEVGAKLINKLPLDLQAENGQPLFKRKLRNLLVQGAFYSVGEFVDRGG
ncbi:hypothetical protein J6590_108364 [Homalodisca vitripennis]|nr:hypothetical protein J6590_108364 [Homalodisca vitripennis]